MGHQRMPSVNGLQEHEVGDVRNPACTRLAEPSGQGLRPLAQHAYQLSDQIGQYGGSRDSQTGWDIAIIQVNTAIGMNFGDACNAEAGEAGPILSLEHVAQA